MEITGKVVSGKNHFSWVLKNIEGLWDLYKKKSGLSLFPGTLNIELDYEFSIPLNSVRIESYEYGGDVSASFYPCTVDIYKGIIIRTDKNESGKGAHSKFIIEIGAEVKLREVLNLSDGDNISIKINL